MQSEFEAAETGEAAASAHAAEALLQLLHVLAGKLAHHALHCVKLLEQTVYVDDRCAAAGSYALFARGVSYLLLFVT